MPSRTLRSFRFAPLSVRMMATGILILFLAPRVTLLFVRAPFFDELFTRWIAARSFAGILQALHYDSGPPLYYFIIHALGDPPLLVARAVSLLFATIALVALLAVRQFTAALLLAVFPPAVLFAVDARAYALCAMFVTLGVLAMESDRPYAAAMAFVAAAYSHYYGALFFPLLLLPLTPTLSPHAGRGSSASREPSPRAVGRGWRAAPGGLAFLLEILLFVPGFWLAFHQPRGSMAWIGAFPAYPEALFAKPPLWLMVIAGLLLVIAAVRWNRFTLVTLLPLALAIALRIYFPLRFESVIAAPLVLWLASVGAGFSPPGGAKARLHILIVSLLVAVGLAICAMGIVDHLQRPVDDYRDAAMHLRGVRGTIVASGYLYLEAVSVAGERVVAFPPEQALHPGWRATAQAESNLPEGTFLWIGERAAPELTMIRRSRRVAPIYVNGRAAIVKVN